MNTRGIFTMAMALTAHSALAGYTYASTSKDTCSNADVVGFFGEAAEYLAKMCDNLTVKEAEDLLEVALCDDTAAATDKHKGSGYRQKRFLGYKKSGMDGTFCTDEDVAEFLDHAIDEIADHCDIKLMEANDILEDEFCNSEMHGKDYGRDTCSNSDIVGFFGEAAEYLAKMCDNLTVKEAEDLLQEALCDDDADTDNKKGSGYNKKRFLGYKKSGTDGTFCTDEDVAEFLDDAVYEIADHCNIKLLSDVLDVLGNEFCDDSKNGWKQ